MPYRQLTASSLGDVDGAEEPFPETGATPGTAQTPQAAQGPLCMEEYMTQQTTVAC